MSIEISFKLFKDKLSVKRDDFDSNSIEGLYSDFIYSIVEQIRMPELSSLKNLYFNIIPKIKITYHGDEKEEDLVKVKHNLSNVVNLTKDKILESVVEEKIKKNEYSFAQLDESVIITLDVDNADQLIGGLNYPNVEYALNVFNCLQQILQKSSETLGIIEDEGDDVEDDYDW